ncbi:DUF4269 domain-containing protein [Schlesneria sp. DSM 10557]|uniref:DUF4269 domain-containing protein n=1 Tax=Schlesneria sp. DSM 10557 TaxID=3044399 RepID=UPI0035A06DEF
MRVHYEQILADLDLLAKLAEFRPMVIGTPPLGIMVTSSDIDVACEAADLDHFRDRVLTEFQQLPAFAVRSLSIGQQPTCIANFEYRGWPIELFCQQIPVQRQAGVRHFLIEQRLLRLHPELRPLIQQAPDKGQKTEPAFAQALGLTGDPYESLLLLEDLSDEQLAAWIITNGR